MEVLKACKLRTKIKILKMEHNAIVYNIYMSKMLSNDTNIKYIHCTYYNVIYNSLKSTLTLTFSPPTNINTFYFLYTRLVYQWTLMLSSNQSSNLNQYHLNTKPDKLQFGHSGPAA